MVKTKKCCGCAAFMILKNQGCDFMKKISQGKFEICTTKVDAIDKFMQLQGLCREEINGYQKIEFYCTKKGKITVTNSLSKHIENTHSTSPHGEIIEQDG